MNPTKISLGLSLENPSLHDFVINLSPIFSLRLYKAISRYLVTASVGRT